MVDTLVEKKSFFKCDADRNLWIRLNAERIRYSQKILNKINEPDLGNVDKEYSHLWVSNNQLEYDEISCDAPRFSLEELSGLSHEELFRLNEKKNIKIIESIFNSTFNDDFIIYDEEF